MPVMSQNGWPVNPSRTARTVPGTNVKISVADGVAGDVLMYVAAEFDKRVEPIGNARGELDDWGWANRPIRGGTATSNHASATAIDLNATQHPLGVRGTFTPAQVDAIHAILDEVDHVVRWGGDYTGRADEMHFEINADRDAVERVAERLGDDMPTLAEIHDAVWFGAPGAKLIPVRQPGKPDGWAEYVLGSLSDWVVRFQLEPMRRQLAALTDLVAKQNGVSADEIAAALRDGLVADLAPVLREVVADALDDADGDQADEISERVLDGLAARLQGGNSDA